MRTVIPPREPYTWFAVCDAEYLQSYSLGARDEQQRAEILEDWAGKICGEYATSDEAFAVAREALVSWLEFRVRGRKPC